uniref:Uncharacterized protein n=1 Tax=Alexandrium catenella TaxID=2925 RepID=A0A7S1MMX4_ALECA
MATPEDGGAASPWLRRFLILIPFVGVLAVLVYNAFFWYRYATAQVAFDSMEQGTCVLNSPGYSVPWNYLKSYHSYPLAGTFGMAHSAWTKVPCDVNLTVFDAHGSRLPPSSPGRTLVYFTYWQHLVIDVIHDTCSRLVPKQAQAGRFDCSFNLDAERSVSQGVYIGSMDELPDYPDLYLMKAAGLSTCTLGPIALLICFCAKGAMKRHRRSVAAREADSSDLRNTGKPLLAGA